MSSPVKTYEELWVGLGARSYPIWIGAGILGRLAEALSKAEFPKRIAVVSNLTVASLYSELLLSQLRVAGYQVELIQLPDGEQFKTLETLNLLFEALIRGNYDRHSGLIALGGGVIGDMVGFAAATYLRGVPFVQVPTTLLAQVDSSVGGKTAVNHPLGKNLIGAFYQPRHVHIDVDTLTSLPPRELSAGLAEVVKYGVICDREFFGWLRQNGQALLSLDPSVLAVAVKRSCQIKANVVESDEKESSLRAILNYGHTFGHAVETLSGYGQCRHGEAVAIGMVVAAELSRRLGRCEAADVAAIKSLLVSFKLPVYPPSFSLDAYLEAMGRDKKVKDGRLRFILNLGIGDCEFSDITDPEPLFAAILQDLMPG